LDKEDRHPAIKI